MRTWPWVRAMEKIGPRTPLLLFNFASPRRLYGPFYADGPAALCIVADAWQDGATGRGRRGGRGGRGDGEATTPYPSQVRVYRAGGNFSFNASLLTPPVWLDEEGRPTRKEGGRQEKEGGTRLKSNNPTHGGWGKMLSDAEKFRRKHFCSAEN